MSKEDDQDNNSPVNTNISQEASSENINQSVIGNVFNGNQTLNFNQSTEGETEKKSYRDSIKETGKKPYSLFGFNISLSLIKFAPTFLFPLSAVSAYALAHFFFSSVPLDHNTFYQKIMVTNNPVAEFLERILFFAALGLIAATGFKVSMWLFSRYRYLKKTRYFQQ